MRVRERVYKGLVYFYLVFMIFVPLIDIICNCSGDLFELKMYPIASILFVIIAFIVPAFYRKQVLNIHIDRFLFFSPVFLFGLSIFFLRKSNSNIVSISLVLTLGCGIWLMFVTKRSKDLKIAMFIISIVLCFVLVICGALMNFSAIKVVRTVESTDKKYYAEIVDCDEGALGGATLVEVYTSRKLDCVLFTIDKKPIRVYTGRWGEYADMDISWNGERSLVINSVEYTF